MDILHPGAGDAVKIMRGNGGVRSRARLSNQTFILRPLCLQAIGRAQRAEDNKNSKPMMHAHEQHFLQWRSAVSRE